MDNIPEPKMRALVQESRAEFVLHTRNHLVRIYPDGLRTDSSNMNPIPAMGSGCQIVAFNYQDKSKETQVFNLYLQSQYKKLVFFSIKSKIKIHQFFSVHFTVEIQEEVF